MERGAAPPVPLISTGIPRAGTPFVQLMPTSKAKTNSLQSSGPLHSAAKGGLPCCRTPLRGPLWR
jgi:hypothetical protein